MIGVQSARLAVFILICSALPASAQQSTSPRRLDLTSAFERHAVPTRLQGPPRRDPLWNGALIGAAAGIGSVVALDALLCEVPSGRCDTPWLAYFTLGGIGAAAGAGIDFLIGRKQDETRPVVRLGPVMGRDTTGVRASIRF